MSFKRISFLDLPLDAGGDVDDLCRMLREKKAGHLITLVGPGAWMLARKNPQYADALKQMSLVLPGSAGIALACSLLTENCNSFGFDSLPFAQAFFEMALEAKLRMALAGGAPGIDEEVHTKLVTRYPGLNIVQTTHGYGDFVPKIATLKAKTPDLVMVGMGAPRQEAFLMALRDGGYKGSAITCDDFFDHFDLFPAVVQPDLCPAWVDRWNLRHLYRVTKKPQDLWRYYLIDYPLFVLLALKTIAVRLIEIGRAIRRKSK